MPSILNSPSIGASSSQTADVERAGGSTVPLAARASIPRNNTQPRSLADLLRLRPVTWLLCLIPFAAQAVFFFPCPQILAEIEVRAAHVHLSSLRVDTQRISNRDFSKVKNV